MSPFVVSGAKYEELENKNLELERKNAELETELSLLKEKIGTLEEKLGKLEAENKELSTKVNSTVFSVDRSDVEKTKDDLMNKAKSAVSDYMGFGDKKE